MGIIRGFFLVIVSTLFLISLLAGNIFLMLSLSLTYDNVKTEFISSMKNASIEGINVEGVIESNYHVMQEFCQNASAYSFVEDELGEGFTIPCEIISQGPTAIVDYGFDSILEEVYYDNYDCGFLDCFEKTGSPLFLISEKAHDYWNNKFYLSLIASVVFLVLMFFLVKHKTNMPFVVGGLLVVSSLPFMKLGGLLSFLEDKFILEYLAVFFTESRTVFLLMLFLGITVLVAGILLKIFKVGFKISNIFKKKNVSEGNKNILKEKIIPEIKKKKNKKSK